MNAYRNIFISLFLGFAFYLSSYHSFANQNMVSSGNYLLKICDSNDVCAYVNQQGDTVIRPGKYGMCFTAIFRTFAVVWQENTGLVAIDRQENIMYEVVMFDNGPDEPSNGLFRILVNHKIGYANAATGAIVIPPKFDCALPFVKGVAQVSTNCTTKTEGEHSEWLSDHWEYIDKTGKAVNEPKKKRQ